MSYGASRGGKQAPAHIAGPRLLLVVCVIALLGIGLVMVYSASSVKAISETGDAAHYLVNQLLYILAGCVMGAIVYFIPCNTWRSGRVLIGAAWLIAIALLVATAAFGTDMNGAKRWLKINSSVGVQPSEFAKIAFCVVAARLMHDYREKNIGFWPCVGWFAALIVVPLILFIYKLQSDLGTTLICVVGIFAVLWLGKVPWQVILFAGLVGGALVLYAIVGTDYRSDRLVFLDPWNDGQDGYGSGYNIIRSFYAFAEGGLFGVGLGNSHEKYLYLFASESDFIFAIIGGELGIVGALLVVALFLAFLVAGLRIADAASDSFGTFVAGGCTIMIVFQAFLNMGCAMGVLPTTGKPLPFISAGGSSMIATLMMVAFILSVAREAASANVYERRRADLRVVRANKEGATRDSYGVGVRAGGTDKRGTDAGMRVGGDSSKRGGSGGSTHAVENERLGKAARARTSNLTGRR